MADSTTNLSDFIYRVLNGGYFHLAAGDPEGVVIAPVGAIYLHTDGGASSTFYVKESGTGNTGWAAMAAAA